MLTKNVVEFLYSTASMQRWNDHIRVDGFTELDKQAHKAMILYVLGRHEEDEGTKPNWRVLVEGLIFEYIHRSFLTDIKPPVFHELVRECKRELNDWVYKQVDERVPDLDKGLRSRMEDWFDKSDNPLEKQLVRAAHYLATQWEFAVIYRLNEGRYGIEETKKEIESELLNHKNLAGTRQVVFGGPTKNFIDLVGQLRYQKRWAQSERLPSTSVLGHSLIVAMFGYMCNLQRGRKDAETLEDFWRGLFHDLPEVLTRDIVSPVKKNVAGLDEVISRVENKLINEKILPLLPEHWRKDMLRITQGFDAASLMKACDNLAAYMEVKLSQESGVTSRHMEEAAKAMEKQYKDKVIDGIDFGKLFV
ncbi:MAG: HD domain-containing protein [Phascolarctobacterium sp.]|nr:HD domain-containing protein [Phascolarctobacterium sp.]